MTFETIWDKYGSTALELLLVLVIGLTLIKLVMNLLRKGLQKSKIDVTAHKFILTICKFLLLFLLALAILETLNIKASSVLAAFGVVGLAVSLAVQDTLSNVASGFLLLMTRPFEVGDYVQVNNVEGTVIHISIVNTKLDTIDNKAVYIPNRQITDSVITNFTREEQRRLDLKFSIAYHNDFRKAKEILLDIVTHHPMALQEPEPVVRLCEHGDSALKILVRVWVKSEDYWDLNFDLLEEVKLRFDEAGIEIPYQHMDVIVHHTKKPDA
ncbi:Small-conductance mechanosensitive channel [uncultured Ruminococcus sp.]|uniref:Mechanosensitive ion channel n=1 Tax=Massiliimalia timonensis TaxID=1987501 RepID=A0A8J6TPG4_9FIRM|nr:mechanosensitive ion channel domain-containing protein [Massiliimalia timonensis]MBC8610164.1 mechanosensitive ion channel [Massiliimalia timonensis]SCH06758.1 Small-conductance mechanosensitive channel [uncultured Ruminococcus sp.]SCH76178.1 Small-conductance mechanosensitive channel [uncultured Clostridium sp.]